MSRARCLALPHSLAVAVAHECERLSDLSQRSSAMQPPRLAVRSRVQHPKQRSALRWSMAPHDALAQRVASGSWASSKRESR